MEIATEKRAGPAVWLATSAGVGYCPIAPGTAGSLVGVVTALIEQGAKEVHACATHALLSGAAVKRIGICPVKEVVVTDTYPVATEKRIDKITVLPIAPMLGEAIRRIHTGQSIGAMFE